MSSIKQTIKKIAPKGAKNVYRSVMRTKERTVSFRYDKRRFLKHHGKQVASRSQQSHIEGRLVFHAHALEKGLSHQVVRLGFGKTALAALASNINTYLSKGYSKDGEGYQNAISVLRAYIELHENAKFDIEYLNKIFPAAVLNEARSNESNLGGISIVREGDKTVNGELNFKELFGNRWSIREYSPEPVDASKIDEVIEIARKTPSICNRQSSRVTAIYDKEVIAAALKLQGGITGYELPPALLMITTDTAAFIDVNERNQVFIDGGLYAMSVLMGLEYVSLGACPLNAMMSVKNDKKMRKLLSIPTSENIIMFISVGNFLEENKVPKSFRYSAENVKRQM